MGPVSDFHTIIDAARLCQNEKIRFVLCGTGDLLADLKKYAAGCERILFPGWVGRMGSGRLLGRRLRTQAACRSSSGVSSGGARTNK